MSIKKWISDNTDNLNGRLVAITGATGGIGCELCRHLALLGADLVLLNRSLKKSLELEGEIRREFASINISHITLDLEDICSVKAAVEKLKCMPIDILIHNAGAYSIPRHKCETGLDNVFQINFMSPYYITRELLPSLNCRENARVVIVGSIAHNYSKTDPDDRDFSTRKQSSLVYGNAKRYLMLSMYKLFEETQNTRLSITHPGITFTNITAHYPRLIFAVIKHPMKIIFMKPRTAALSLVKGVFDKCDFGEWIGPRIFDIWGRPKKRMISTFNRAEADRIFSDAEELYTKMKETF